MADITTGNSVVDAIGAMSISGNVTPNHWYQIETFRGGRGKPNLLAILILSDLLYWYRPTEIRDEKTGETIGWKKKFAGDMLQRSYADIAKRFGVTKYQATEACKFLEDRKLITLDLRTVTLGEVVCNNRLFINLCTDAIKTILAPPPVISFTQTLPQSTAIGSTSQLPDPPPLDCQTNTKITTKTSTENTTHKKNSTVKEKEYTETEEYIVQNQKTDFEPHSQTESVKLQQMDLQPPPQAEPVVADDPKKKHGRPKGAKNKTTKTKTDSEPDPAFDAWFDQFYSMYPRYGRSPAYQAAKNLKLTPEQRDAVLAGLKRQLPELLAREPEFRPLPKTWLNQRRWEDKLDSEAPAAKKKEPEYRSAADMYPDLAAQKMPDLPKRFRPHEDDEDDGYDSYA